MLLRTRIILGALASTLVVMLVLLVSGNMLVGQSEQRFEQEVLGGKALLWDTLIDNQLDMMAAGMSGVTRDREIRNALSKGDAGKLMENASPAYKRLSTMGVLSKLQMVDLQGKVLFSAPDGFSGNTRKQLVGDALSSGKVVRGSERDDDGKLYATLAFPLLKRGKPVGIAVYLQDFQAAAAQFKEKTGADLFFVAADGQVDYATDPGLLDQIETPLPPAGEKKFETERIGDNTYVLAITPISDQRGDPLAHMIAVSDHTESYAAAERINWTSYALAAAGLVLSLLVLVWYIKREFKPLECAIAALQRIAEWDLTDDIEATSRDEIGRLLGAMADTVVSLREMIQQIKQASGQLTDSSQGLQQVAEATSQDVAKQMEDTGQVATAMTEMAATVQEVALNAERAATAAREARDDAADGRQVVQQSIQAISSLAGEIENAATVIQRLEAESSEIGGVLDVIRGIAEQTNLLALNAAIEAARAGEQGRGFAVVADEVRSLASRTQQSTQDIQQMIERLQTGTHEAVKTMNHSLGQVKRVVEQTGATGASLETISNAVETIAEMNTQIATAVEEQRVVVEEIDRNVININQAAERSAEGARETSCASRGLQEWTQRLNQSVERFRI